MEPRLCTFLLLFLGGFLLLRRGLLWRSFALALEIFYTLQTVILIWIVTVPIGENSIQLFRRWQPFQRGIVVVLQQVALQSFPQHLDTYSFILWVVSFIKNPALKLVNISEPGRRDHSTYTDMLSLEEEFGRLSNKHRRLPRSRNTNKGGQNGRN